MESTIRTAAQSLCAPFCLMLVMVGMCNHSQAQVFGPNSREARFPTIALRSAEERVSDSAGTDFYEDYIKGKTVLINFFYTECNQQLCDQVMSNLVQVQRLLGNRLGPHIGKGLQA